MQDPNPEPLQPTHVSPDGNWVWNGTQWVPNYRPAADIPADSPYHRSPAPSRRASGGIGASLVAALAAAWAYGKYVLLFIFKVPALTTLVTGLIAMGGYALLFPWQVAIGLVLMIFVHEMGHVVEIRRQGMQATAPVFIPFLGAAIFQKSHATSAIKQAEIGIAGPIAGTVAAIAAYFIFLSTNNPIYLEWAYWGFWLNLFNMIPFGMLDGGWVLAPVSKWIQLAGLGLLLAMFLAHIVNPLVVLVVALGMPMVYRRFKDRAYDAYLTSGPQAQRLALGGAWLGLVLVLGIGLYQTEQMIFTFVR